MQILWAFRYNPWRIGKQRICVSKFATNPIARPQTGAFFRETRHYFFVNETNAEQLIDFAPEGNNAKVNALLKGIVLSQKILSGVQGIARKVYRQIQKDINPKKSTIKEIKDEALPYLHDFEGELTFRDRDAVLDAVVEIARGAVTSQVKLWSMSSRIKEVIHESFDREVIPKQMNALIESLFIFTGITVMVDRVNLSDPYLLRERMISDDHSIVFVLPIQMGERVGEL
ncbi:MAG: hypothetical protein LBK44_03070, partial [Spirochaetales bacterium]|nr:hypothetical protein [Spirochaetales bacterium]